MQLVTSSSAVGPAGVDAQPVRRSAVAARMIREVCLMRIALGYQLGLRDASFLSAERNTRQNLNLAVQSADVTNKRQAADGDSGSKG